VIVDDAPELDRRAALLCSELGCTLSSLVPTQGLVLRLAESGLELLDLSSAGSGAIRAEFVSGRFGYRLRQGVGRREPLGRAVGAGPGSRPRVVDATAGLGRDALLLATLGCQVTALERSPVVAALLDDGLARAVFAGSSARASPADRSVAQAAERVSLIRVDARSWLAALEPALRPAVVLLDPMFPERRKSALVKQDMRVFRQLVGDDGDADQLLDAALQAATQRVVVKRPRDAPSLTSARPPDHAQDAGVTRYDVYLVGD
jgi:16S rRNA (guanine1516-N2)-methyltransferase